MQQPMLITALLLTLLSITELQSQTYVYTISQGAQPYTINIRPDGLLIMSGAADNLLSAWQALPFPWSFYGKPVNGFFASDNGYITFDPAATTSIPSNIAASSPAEPNNAIFAYWEDLHFTGGQPVWTNEIRTITVGTAPNRAFIVMWVSAVPPGVDWSSSNNMSFAIALKEAGGFDVIYIAGRKTVRNLTGSIGCENADGTVSTWVTGSPDIDYPELTASADDDISYHFEYSEHASDLSVFSSNLPKQVKQSTPLSLSGTVKNLGSSTVSSFDLNYSIDGASNVVLPVTGVSLASNATYDFTFPQPWTVPAAGSFPTIRIWASNLNGTEVDEQPSNDTLTAGVFSILGTTASRRVLVEEFTGAWCGWCPDGALMMQTMETTHPTAVLLSIHAGGVDAMKSVIGDSLAATFKPAYPMAMVDRFQFAGQTAVPLNRGGSAWFNRTAEREAVPTPASLTMQVQYDSASRQATVTVNAHYVDYGYPGDARLHVYVVEDRITGTGSGYDQMNYYSQNSSYPNHPYFGETNPIRGFVHRHVLRTSLTGIWGDAAALPPAPLANETYTRIYSFTVPPVFNDREVSFIAFLSSMGNGINERSVINATEAPLREQVAALESPATASAFSLAVYPNPAITTAAITLTLSTRQNVHLSIVDVVGREVMRLLDGEVSPGSLGISIPALPAGIYRIVARTGEKNVSTPYVVLR